MAMTDSLQSKQITDPDLCAAYGAVVRAGRNALGMSQNGLAAALGVHRTTLVRLEQGSPPLRRGLCLSAVDVLKKAGVACEAPEIQTGAGPLNDGSLLITISADAVRKAQQGIEGLIPGDDLTAHFLGAGFLPPLEEKPLRKK
jgi:DNA-binding XRE family transcriptional regulator